MKLPFFIVRMARNKKISKKNIIQIAAMVLTVAVFAAAVIAVVKMVTDKRTSDTEPTSYVRPGSVLTHNGKDYVLKKNVETFLVMGIDDYENMGQTGRYINQSQADVLYLFVVDNGNKTYSTLQLNRDTMTSVKILSPDGRDAGISDMQLALAHAYGRDDTARCLNTVDAVSGLLFDIDIDHYVSLTMDAIPIINEKVGGVTVTIPEDMTAADPAFVKGATVTLHGDQAEKFVRSRESLANDTNTFRMERQKMFLDDWRSKVEEKMNSSTSFALDMFLALSEYMVSDMTVNKMADFAAVLAEYEDKGFITTEGEYSEGVVFKEYNVDMDDLEDKIIDMLYEEAKQ